MSRTRRGAGAQSTMLLAGWLFADLALGLVVILLATATDFPAPAPEPSPTPSPAPVTPSPTPSPTQPPATELGLTPDPVDFRVQVNASALLSGDAGAVAEVADAIREHLAPYEQEGRRAAFVQTYGASASSGEGVALAHAANEVLHETVPDLVEVAVIRDFWQSVRSGEFSRGTIIFEVFLFAGG